MTEKDVNKIKQILNKIKIPLYLTIYIVKAFKNSDINRLFSVLLYILYLFAKTIFYNAFNMYKFMTFLLFSCNLFFLKKRFHRDKGIRTAS